MKRALIALAACAPLVPAPPRDGPVAVASTWTWGGGDVIEVALWANGDVVYQEGFGELRSRIDPARARAILADVERLVAEVPDETRLSDATDQDIVRLAVRTRDGYRVVEVYAFMLTDVARKPPAFVDAYVQLRSARPAQGTPQRFEFPGEAAIRHLVWRPGFHSF